MELRVSFLSLRVALPAHLQVALNVPSSPKQSPSTLFQASLSPVQRAGGGTQLEVALPSLGCHGNGGTGPQWSITHAPANQPMGNEPQHSSPISRLPQLRARPLWTPPTNSDPDHPFGFSRRTLDFFSGSEHMCHGLDVTLALPVSFTNDQEICHLLFRFIYLGMLRQDLTM